MSDSPISPEEIAGRLSEAAVRCEAATGPDRELDLRIAKAVGAIPNCYKFRPDMDGGKLAWGGICGMEVAAYTGSLDAAKTIADGLGGQVTFFKDGTGKAFLWQPYPLAIERTAATPALALCAVALRARATLTQGTDHG